ncbi:hypothetical protein DdX_13326 [Ditylenchus destructor]|uniref:Uncharacterized protein n=1 Tax=Ditylenchus destructor TaxID=166010 RepID=A0AAD4MYU9_9BILA|nr:hypothetical protein DdX_13326 [Ditylenchus destructor]
MYFVTIETFGRQQSHVLGFGRHTIDLWLCLPTATAIWGFFYVRPFVVNSTYGGFFKDPYLGYANFAATDPEYVFVQIFLVCLLCVLTQHTKQLLRRATEVSQFPALVLSSIGYAFNERLLQANPEMVAFVTFGYAIFQVAPPFWACDTSIAFSRRDKTIGTGLACGKSADPEIWLPEIRKILDLGRSQITRRASFLGV